jgi:hypothetical protein
MMQGDLTVIVMVGGGGGSPVEQAVAGAVRACARDTLERCLAAAVFDRIVAATDDAAWAATLSDLPVHVDVAPLAGPFHFGKRLAGLIERYEVSRALYVGGASMPLVDAQMLRAIAARLREAEHCVLTNNIHSSDWAGIAPAARVVDYAERLPTDNALGWVLWRQAGLEPLAWPPSALTLLDLDTPVDVQIAALHPACGPRVRAYTRSLGWDDSRLRAARDVLLTAGKQAMVAGRVPQTTWSYLEGQTLCWLRVFSEERGMRASQRLARGEVRSLLAEYLASVGVQKFFEALAALADTVFLDSRVIMASHGAWPPSSDRFYSDIFQSDQIADPFLREFTLGAASASIPIVLGGHALVAGGLWALLEAVERATSNEK